jgi:protein TonB
MRWASFLLISASLHAHIFTLPLTPSFERDERAIAVTLIIAQDDSSQEPTLEDNAMHATESARPLIASQRQAVLDKTESIKDNEALGLEKTPEEIAQLKIPGAHDDKTTSNKPSEKRMDTGSTMTNAPEQKSQPTDHNSVVDKPNRKGKVQIVLSAPGPEPGNSGPADARDENNVKKDEAKETETAVEISALLEKSDQPTKNVGMEEHIFEESGEADTSEPENLVRKTIGTEAIEERFRNAAPQETTIALRSRQEGDGSREFKPAGYTRRISPKYPERARRKGWEGTTLLRVLIDRRGKSKAIQVSQSSGFAALDGAAVKAVEQWRFYPAQNGNGPVETWVRVPIIFRLVRDQN